MTWLDEDLTAFRELARSFCEKELSPHQERWAEAKQVDRELWNKAGAVGLLCLSIPEEYGGGGGTFAHEAVLLQEQARAQDDAWGVAVHNGIVAHYVRAYGTEEQKLRWLPKMASGELVAAIAMTEPGTGSDLQSIKTKAIRTGDTYVVNGAKTFITNGAQAGLVIVAAKTNPEEKASGVSLVVVETEGTPGFRRGRVLDKIGMKGQDTAELFFDNVTVPAENLLGGQEGQGFVQLMRQLPQERLLIAVTAVAAMDLVVRQTIQYTREREAFGRPIFGFQNTKFVLADAATEVAVSKAFLDQCVDRHLKGELDVTGAAMAKMWTTERLGKVVDSCLQLFGGYGFMNEYPIAKAWTAARVQRIFGGTTEIMKEIIARTL
ncbi:acyl-CoA dehydrogenase family protein [Actinocrispum wychmicini]|uniref:Acyl-CoA dehydrogenase n=1 Tax=Actinocrispum wychmicini TaxID=1213861 RepID=A0A4R2JJ66_9PSEU|nr:acyl-CoA dehydrogenase family protein [Actinocrispum wychmicini]TCO56549.1 acyl-CoA dehydrogenase [Actinocrispum wychmicini]